VEFDKYLKDASLQRDADHLLQFKELSPAGKIAVLIKYHYLPMLYSAALQEEGEKIFLYENIHNASISMRGFIIQ